MKLLILLSFLSIFLVASDTPLDIESAEQNALALDSESDVSLAAEGETCGGEDEVLCGDYMTCEVEQNLMCQAPRSQPKDDGRDEGKNGVEDGVENGPCRADKSCNEGLACATERSAAGLEKQYCAKYTLFRETCRDELMDHPCAEGYECVLKYPGSKSSACWPEGHIEVVGFERACEGVTKAVCGPGLKCVENSRERGTKLCQYDLPESQNEKLPGLFENCSKPFFEPGICAPGLVCHGPDKRSPDEGACAPLGTQGVDCVDRKGFETPCMEGYECLSTGPTNKPQKSCTKKGYMTPARYYEGCGPETAQFCAPGFECVESTVRYKGYKICMRKGEKETAG